MRREKPIFTENEAVGEVHFAYTHENVICKITFFFNELSITSVLAQIVPPLSSRIHYAVQYKFRYNTVLIYIAYTFTCRAEKLISCTNKSCLHIT